MPKINFKDYPEFKPNLTPRQIFTLGSFGGTYWRPIYSNVTKKSYKNQHTRYPKSWWEGIPKEHMISSEYDINVNKYKVKVGTSLRYWESKNWISPLHPYGWIQWYCDFYKGKRSADDERQIKRWLGVMSRFKSQLLKQIITHSKKTNTPVTSNINNYKISPRIRQTLQHWGYVLKSI